MTREAESGAVIKFFFKRAKGAMRSHGIPIGSGAQKPNLPGR